MHLIALKNVYRFAILIKSDNFENLMPINKRLLFTDGSVDVQSKIGYGAVLCISNDELFSQELKQRIQTKRFENTSSTKLELQTLIWALAELELGDQKIIIYTDSQNITQLLERRQRLEKSYFRSKSGELLNNYELYKEFFQMIDLLNCKIVKVKGHQPTKYKNEIEHVFTLVDKASRKALRQATK